MSWFGDHLIREALLQKTASPGVGPPLRLMNLLRGKYKGNTLKPYSWGAITPVVAGWPMNTTTETVGIIEGYYQDWASAPTQMSITDYKYIDTWDVRAIHRGEPDLLIGRMSESLLTQSPYSLTGAGAIHFITKDGWVINGISYPSQHFQITFDADGV